MATATAPTTGVTVPRSELARALKAASAVKAKHVHIDLTGDTCAVAVVTAYTPDVAVRTMLDAPITDDAGRAFVTRTLLAGVLPYLGSHVRLSVADDQLTVESGESVFELRTAREHVPAPNQPEEPKSRFGRALKNAAAQKEGAHTFGHDFTAGDPVTTFEAPTLVEVLRRVLPFVSRDQTRPVLATVALYPDSCCAAATDSYRLTVVRYDDGPDKPTEAPILVRVEAATALQRMLSKKLGTVTITAAETHYLVEFEDLRWSILRLPPPTQHESGNTTGGYPQWWNLLPDQKPDTTVKVDREDLLTASRAASALTPKNAPLRLNVGFATGATVSLVKLDTAKMTRRLASAEVLGADMEVGFNPEFMADVCAVAPVERLTVKLIGPLRPALVEAARDLYLLMPIRLNV